MSTSLIFMEPLWYDFSYYFETGDDTVLVLAKYSFRDKIIAFLRVYGQFFISFEFTSRILNKNKIIAQT